MSKLEKNSKFAGRKGPVVLIIMDGMGIAPDTDGNAFAKARTPILDSLMKGPLYTTLKAHGTAVGLPSNDDMGNSEVGHNALGAGRVFDQGAKLVQKAIDSGDIYTSNTWKELIQKPLTEGTTMHFIGLLSDGNVHSHIDHLLRLLDRAATEGVKKARVHILLDGRDVPETSAFIYVDMLDAKLAEINAKGNDYRVASGGGRMVTTMDRYEADWTIVKRGWEAHVLGEARAFKSAKEAIETYRAETPGLADQYLPSFTIVDDKGAVGPIIDGDSVVLCNFRGDRAIEISVAFDSENFNKFDRKRFPKVVFAGMMEYDGDLHVPKKYLVTPPAIDRPISEYLSNTGVRQYAVSETQKFGHVTYFWNGNRSGKFDDAMEVYDEIPSDRVTFEQRPWMKAAEITDKTIDAIASGKYRFVRLNLANGDMVGHTGNFQAAVIAAETVDLCLSRILPVIKDAGGLALITADHGNLDEMFELDKTGKVKIDKKTGEPEKKTAHTLNPVPFIVYDPSFNGEYEVVENKEAGLGNIASTVVNLLGYNAPADYLPSLVKFK
ncbi:MAG TPA: 2,3-bisphosphoglycerate-independent phosphoglycerate mutase [Spirochaetota bacterium]